MGGGWFIPREAPCRHGQIAVANRKLNTLFLLHPVDVIELTDLDLKLRIISILLPRYSLYTPLGHRWPQRLYH